MPALCKPVRAGSAPKMAGYARYTWVLAADGRMENLLLRNTSNAYTSIGSNAYPLTIVRARQIDDQNRTADAVSDQASRLESRRKHSQSPDPARETSLLPSSQYSPSWEL